MMQLVRQPFGTYEEYVLHNPRRGDAAYIVPAYGARLRHLVLAQGGQPVPLIQGATTEADFLADGGYPSAHLFPFPSRIRDGKYTFQGQTYFFPINEPARGHAIHGFVHDEVFEVLQQEATAQHARLTLRRAYRGGFPGYPFSFDLDVTYTLTAGGVLELAYQLCNVGTTPLPAGLGWHPYFGIGGTRDTWEINLPVREAVVLDDRMMPAGTEPFAEAGTWVPLRDRTLDDAFALADPEADGGTTTRLRDSRTGRTFHLWQERGAGKFEYLVVYTPGETDRIAIEPLSCNVDAFNTGEGLLVLPPGQTHALRCRVWLA